MFDVSSPDALPNTWDKILPDIRGGRFYSIFSLFFLIGVDHILFDYSSSSKGVLRRNSFILFVFFSWSYLGEFDYSDKSKASILRLRSSASSQKSL